MFLRFNYKVAGILNLVLATILIILTVMMAVQGIVGRERAESTNASGEPKCSMKEEILLTGVYNSRHQGGEAIESLAQ